VSARKEKRSFTKAETFCASWTAYTTVLHSTKACEKRRFSC